MLNLVFTHPHKDSVMHGADDTEPRLVELLTHLDRRHEVELISEGLHRRVDRLTLRLSTFQHITSSHYYQQTTLTTQQQTDIAIHLYKPDRKSTRLNSSH